ncbi:MAG: hypothetical protein CMQ83_03340 [Gammaproteobacteria bacterium]|mgnify:CR=1 FL=1|nr:hypothetical protein [Gammaproteobacteria bacterium]
MGKILLTTTIFIILLLTSCNRDSNANVSVISSWLNSASQYEGLWFLDKEKTTDSCLSAIDIQNSEELDQEYSFWDDVFENTYSSLACSVLIETGLNKQLIIKNNEFKHPYILDELKSICFIKRGGNFYCGQNESSATSIMGNIKKQESLLILEFENSLGENENIRLIYKKE